MQLFICDEKIEKRILQYSMKQTYTETKSLATHYRYAYLLQKSTLKLTQNFLQ